MKNTKNINIFSKLIKIKEKTVIYKNFQMITTHLKIKKAKMRLKFYITFLNN